MKIHRIPPELYDRLAGFDRWCTFSMSRCPPHTAVWKAYPRTWRVTISHPKTKMHVGIAAEFPALADALEVALDIAEWFEWDKEVPPLDSSPVSSMTWTDREWRSSPWLKKP